MRQLVDIFESVESKSFKKLTKNKDFVFTLVCYPSVLLVYLIVKFYLSDFRFSEQVGFWYAFISFGFLVFLIIMTVYERVDRGFHYKGQGDKLKMKQKEGSWRA